MNRMHWRMIVTVGLALALAQGMDVTFKLKTIAQENNEAAGRDARLQNVAGFERNDLAALSQVWAKHESVTVFENGHAKYGWADYRDHHLVSEMTELKNAQYALIGMPYTM